MDTLKKYQNKNIDIGALMIEDCECYEGLDDEEITQKTQKNICALYQSLFDLKKKQRLDEGEQGEILEYTRAQYSVVLPKPQVILPREKPIPKERIMTKWEKFRIEKGIAEKEKRSRMVFDPVTNDWVPRYGMGSVKKIEEKHNWLMEEKPKHRESGIDPFTYKKNEKKIEQEKQDLRELKNKITMSGPAGKGKGSMDQILDNAAKKDSNGMIEEKDKAAVALQQDGRPKIEMANLKTREEGERATIRKRERKALLKSLQLAQMSTASMGKFDQKVNKYEPDAPNTQKKLKKKSNSILQQYESNQGAERERNMKILGLIGKEKQLKESGGDKVKGAMNVNQMLRKNQSKVDKFNKNNKTKKKDFHIRPKK